ncbi:MAG: FkbM family methyltransferase [Chloroherpetonaceae bacterium]|nr:FkbM family methyltransferase [Chloroherpetonaceae bacterium]
MALSDKLDGLKSIWKFDNRWQLLLSRLLFRKNGLNVYCLDEMKILIDHSAGDESGTRHVLVSPMYQQFLAKMTFPNSINVLDLGGNGGGFALMLQHRKIPLKKVVAVEFNPYTHSRMTFNLRQNLECEFVALNAAVCGEAKSLCLQLGRGGTSDNIYNPVNRRQGKVMMIQGITIDELYETYFRGETIDLCKMDIEGAEHEVFAYPHHNAMRHV